MSDQIPFHIQEDIIKRLPVKPLLQFRSVSKAWKSLIDSSEFIAAQSALHTHPQHLLVKYEDLVETEDKYVSFIDDDTFLQQRFVPTLPFSVKSLNLSTIVGSSHGLSCLYGYHWGPETSHRSLKSPKTVLWNPSVRKSVVVDMPNLVCGGEEIAVGFGVCPVTSDPKIVEITQLRSWVDLESETSDFWKAKVYTLSSRKWRNISSNLPSKSIRVTWSQVVIDRFIYWCAYHMLTIHTYNLIMSFDMTDENFRVVDLPDSLEQHSQTELSVSKLRESLAILQYNIDTDTDTDTDKHVCSVWMMEHGV
ncbi:F-box protein At2g21930 [Lactuca sativa]|uniref:F-box protein At2g21930 n=1 Tax=Lactuca sativa TaxID=4236 RepID=UPI000CBD1A96|nr:F-box protein At2g21930 [Lactuca sativa]